MKTRIIGFAGATLLALALGCVGVGVSAAQAHARPRNPGQRGALVYGVVEAIEGNSLALATPIGAVTVITDTNTRFRLSDAEEPGLNDFEVGDILGAAGWWEEDRNAFHAFGVARLEADHIFPLTGGLSDVSDESLTVDTGRGPATVHVDGETAYRIHGVRASGPDDLEVGERITIKGTLNLDGSLQARMVVVPWAGARPIRLHGEVLAIEGDTLTIRATGRFQPGRGRRLSVQTDENTEFRIPGVEDPSIADLQVGDRVLGRGLIELIEKEGTGRVQPEGRAQLVLVPSERVARLVGDVVSVEGDTLALDTPGGTVGVLTDAETMLQIPGVEEPTLDDVEIGDQAVVIGTWEDDLSFNAVVVGVRGGRRTGQPGEALGRALRIGTGQFVVGTMHGPVTVMVDGGTRVRVPGVDAPRLDDIVVGDLVGARGTWNEDGTLQATGVAVLGSRRVHGDAREGWDSR